MEISELLKLELNPVILKSGEYILVSASYLLETKDNLVSIMTAARNMKNKMHKC